MKKYTAILELRDLLEKENIPFDFEKLTNTIQQGYLLSYPKYDKPEEGSECVCSVAQHSFSYGSDENLLEIMGLLTDEEREKDTGDQFAVAGWLTVDDVFNRIKKHYLTNK